LFLSHDLWYREAVNFWLLAISRKDCARALCVTRAPRCCAHRAKKYHAAIAGAGDQLLKTQGETFEQLIN
jgi:hypothetical protein